MDMLNIITKYSALPSQTTKRVVSFVSVLFIVLVHSACSANETAIPVTVEIDASQTYQINPYLLGSNLQWVDRGDGILLSDGVTPDSDVIDKAKKMGVSVLRYPGGSLADLYHWKDGMGEIQNRGTNKRFHGDGDDKILLGTAEFLNISKKLGATPIITVNLITGTPEEAADWVRMTNIERVRYQDEILPKVVYWEIGNEPYLIDDNQKQLAISPKDFASRADTFISAMKAVDPTIKVGIPLRSDKLVGVPATPLPGYNKTVLEGVTERIDFVSVHNAYYPYIHAEVPEYSQIYLASMAAAGLVEKNFQQTRQEVNQYRSEDNIKIALTEYNAMFTLNGGESDGFIASWMGAMYLSDLLMNLSRMPDLLMANHWSLIGNWYFGAIGLQGEKRPAFYVLEAFNQIMRGKFLQTVTSSPGFNSPNVGFAPAQQNVSFLNSVSTLDDNVLRILILNKHPMEKANVKINIQGYTGINTVKADSLTVDSIFHYDTAESKVRSKTIDTRHLNNQVELSLPPHTLNIITIE